MLKSVGVPLEFDNVRQRYSIESSYFLPPTNLMEEEALAVLTLASRLGSTMGLPFFHSATQAAEKIENSLPSSLRKAVESSARSIDIRLPPINSLEGKEDCYRQLRKSIAAKRVVRMKYDGLTGSPQISTKLRPYQIVFQRRSWYVIGRSSLHSAVKTFNLGGIVSLKPLREKYRVPRGFSLERYLGNAWNMLPTDGPDHHVVIRFLPLVARHVAQVHWHNTQETELLPDGCLEFRVSVSSLEEIVWWVLGYGDLAEVIQPSRLRQIVAARVNQMQRIYREPKASHAV